MDALRGHLDAVTLVLARDGKEVAVEGHWPAAARIIERRGLWSPAHSLLKRSR